MDLMNVVDQPLSIRRPSSSAEDSAFVGIEEYTAFVRQLCDYRKIRLAKDVYRRYSTGQKTPLDYVGQLRISQPLRANLNVVQARMHPMVDIIFEGYDRPCEAEYNQEDGPNYSKPEMDFE
jgi:hypothetical protein